MENTDDVLARLTPNMEPKPLNLSSLPVPKKEPKQRKSRFLPEGVKLGAWWHCHPFNPLVDHQKCKGQHKQVNPLPSATCKCECHTNLNK